MRPARSRWQRFKCWLGLHPGPFNIEPHVIVCDVCAAAS